MPFEDFYKDENERSRRWWKIVPFSVFLLIGYYTLSFWFFSLFEPEEPQSNTTSNFTAGVLLRRVDELCTNLPTPENFYFVSRKIIQTAESRTEVMYLYSSNRSFEEIMPTYLIWFGKNSWKTEKNEASRFRKNRQTVFIKKNEDSHGYEIHCSEEQISFGIYD